MRTNMSCFRDRNSNQDLRLPGRVFYRSNYHLRAPVSVNVEDFSTSYMLALNAKTFRFRYIFNRLYCKLCNTKKISSSIFFANWSLKWLKKTWSPTCWLGAVVRIPEYSGFDFFCQCNDQYNLFFFYAFVNN